MAKQHSQAYRLYKRGNTYHAYISFITEAGARIRLRESTKAVELEAAHKYCLKRINQIQQKAHAVATGELERITVDYAFTKYFNEKGQYLTLPKQRLSRLNKMKSELPVIYLDEIKEPEITNFIQQNRKDLTNATINRYLYLLSAVISTARDEWKVRTYPIKISKFKLKEPAENIKYLKNWEIAQKIIDKAPEHLKPIIYTALYTGLRESNILNLKWENVDLESKTITLKVKDSTRSGGKIHTVPIIPQLAQILHKQEKISEYVFTYHGKHISSITSAWRNIFYKRADKKHKYVLTKELRDPELPYTNFHTLRHTAATWILKKTNNLRITKEILGHSNINTTLKYAHVLDDEKRNALNSVFN